MSYKTKTESEIASNLFQEYSALDSGLVHYWKLDDNDNTAQNQISSSPNGTLVNSPTWIGNYNGSYYRPEIISSTDYSPFLVRLDGRSFSTSEYRYSGQGQEHDDNIKGEGNSLNYTYRMHDPRLGRFFAVDPLAGDYPHNSTYAFSENKLTRFIELEGLEKKDPMEDCFDFDNKKSGFGFKFNRNKRGRKFKLPRIKLMSVEVNHEMNVICWQTINLREPVPGGSIDVNVNMGNTTSQVNINYNMNREPDEIIVTDGAGFRNASGFVSGTGTIAIPFGSTSVNIQVRPRNSSSTTSIYSVNMNYTDTRVFTVRTKNS